MDDKPSDITEEELNQICVEVLEDALSEYLVGGYGDE